MKFFTKNKCYNGGQKHNFISVYKEEKPKIHNFEGSIYQYETLISLETKKTYLHSVCKWCGKIADKEDD